MKKIDTKEPINYLHDSFEDTLSMIRTQILDAATGLVKRLGGKINMNHYFDEGRVDRYTFYDTDKNGYGVELFLDEVSVDKKGNLLASLSDTEETYDITYDQSDFDTSDALYLLKQLEDVAQYVMENGGEVVDEQE